MGKRLFWVDDNAIHNGPDHEGYWLIDGGGYEATEVQAITDAWGKEYHDDPIPNDWKYEIRKWWPELAVPLDALIEEN